MRLQLMLFDEVTSALDPELCGEVLSVIRRLGKEYDLTTLMVMHQMVSPGSRPTACVSSQSGRSLRRVDPRRCSARPRMNARIFSQVR
jgi:polar amino acid transport system ATP-binding protein